MVILTLTCSNTSLVPLDHILPVLNFVFEGSTLSSIFPSCPLSSIFFNVIHQTTILILTKIQTQLLKYFINLIFNPNPVLTGAYYIIYCTWLYLSSFEFIYLLLFSRFVFLRQKPLWILLRYYLNTSAVSTSWSCPLSAKIPSLTTTVIESASTNGTSYMGVIPVWLTPSSWNSILQTNLPNFPRLYNLIYNWYITDC